MSPHYPWPTFTEPWTLDITDVAVDGRPRDELRDESHRRLRADLVDGWNELTFAATARKPDGATGITVKRVHLLVSSPRSQTRIPVLLNDRGQDWFAEVRL